MIQPTESFLGPAAASFRILSWGSGTETVLFLHGLSGVAEVWQPTVEALPPVRRYVAMDARGHGRSFAPATGYSAADMVADTRAAIAELGVPVHLVGHSMGARTALLVAARSPALLRSVAVVDIGPEASKRNIATTVRGIEGRPDRFANRQEAIAFAFRSRVPTPLDERIFLARLQTHGDGSLTWRASKHALTEAVRQQRSRSYWSEWRRITLPAVFVHGSASNEVSTVVADRMVAENPRVAFRRLPGVGHNVPLIAPGQLAEILDEHWTAASRSAR